MACLKGLTALMLTHVRFTPQVYALFDAVAITVSISMHIEASTPSSAAAPFRSLLWLMSSAPHNQDMYRHLLLTLSPPIALVLVVAAAHARPLRS